MPELVSILSEKALRPRKAKAGRCLREVTATAESCRKGVGGARLERCGFFSRAAQRKGCASEETGNAPSRKLRVSRAGQDEYETREQTKLDLFTSAYYDPATHPPRAHSGVVPRRPAQCPFQKPRSPTVTQRDAAAVQPSVADSHRSAAHDAGNDATFAPTPASLECQPWEP